MRFSLSLFIWLSLSDFISIYRNNMPVVGGFPFSMHLVVCVCVFWMFFFSVHPILRFHLYIVCVHLLETYTKPHRLIAMASSEPKLFHQAFGFSNETTFIYVLKSTNFPNGKYIYMYVLDIYSMCMGQEYVHDIYRYVKTYMTGDVLTMLKPAKCTGCGLTHAADFDHLDNSFHRIEWWCQSNEIYICTFVPLPSALSRCMHTFCLTNIRPTNKYNQATQHFSFISKQNTAVGISAAST